MHTIVVQAHSFPLPVVEIICSLSAHLKLCLKKKQKKQNSLNNLAKLLTYDCLAAHVSCPVAFGMFVSACFQIPAVNLASTILS